MMPTPGNSNRLDAHTDWTFADAAHLLRRAGLGATPQEVADVLELGRAAAVERLVVAQPESASFQQANTILRQSAIDTNDVDNLKAWWLYRMVHTVNPLRERMTLLWHNHFATSYTKVGSIPAMLDQNDLFRTEALGSFRKLLHGISRDVAMLIWLDSNSNRKRQPNENYARELMELFALDVGNYTEADIQEAARAFTGWHVRQNKFWFNRSQHDAGTKTVLGHTGPFNGNEVVDLCLDQPACPRFLAVKLLREFVTASPSEPLVASLAAVIRRCDFAFEDVLRELLNSRAFYAAEHRGVLIKSPIDLTVGTFRLLGMQPNLDAAVRVNADLGQDLFQPPTVKGWDGHRTWLTSATLLQRTNFVAAVARNERFGERREADLRQAFASGSRRRLLIETALAANSTEQTARLTEEELASGRQQQQAWLQLLLSLPEYQLK